MSVGDGTTGGQLKFRNQKECFVPLSQLGMLERKNMLMYMQMEIERSELEKRRGVSGSEYDISFHLYA